MGKLVVTEFVTLDGVMESPHEWSFEFSSEEFEKFKLDELMRTDALLLGRVTYEGFAEAWPDRTDEQGFAVKFNSMPKFVVSKTLKDPEWNNSTVIEGDLEEEINKLKAETVQDITIHGSATLVNSLLKLGLIDEYRLMVYPIVLGAGKRLFADGLDKTVMKLVDTEALGNGVIVLTYQPADAEVS